MNTQQLPRLEAGEYPGGIWYYEPHTYQPYRFVLGRVGRHPLVCIGINPSTAQPGALDPTLKSVERLAAAILARMQAQAAARMDRHGRPQTNPYMTNVAHPAILTLYTQWKRSIDAGTYAVGDLDRIMFELSLLNDRAVAALEKEYAKELTTNDGLP